MNKKQEINKLVEGFIRLYELGYPIVDSIEIFLKIIGNNNHKRQDFKLK
jgi:hypothetical protein